MQLVGTDNECIIYKFINIKRLPPNKFGLKFTPGKNKFIQVNEIEQDSVASTKDINEDDIIIAINDIFIKTVKQAIQLFKKNTTIKLLVLRHV